MRRESVWAYLHDAEDRAAVSEAIDRLHLSGRVIDGDIEQAIEEAAGWTLVPDYLVIDISRASDPAEAISRMSERAPAGETNVIAVGGANDIGLYRRLKRIGVAEYMARPISAAGLEEIVDGILKERRLLGKAIEPSRFVVVTGARGGAGCSTIAMAIADAFSVLQKRKTLLIDGDLEAGAQLHYANVESTIGMLDMLQDPRRIDAHLLERTMARVSKTLSLLSVDQMRGEMQVHPEGLKSLVLQAHRGIDTVVLDLPCRSLLGRDPLLSAGLVVIVAPPTLLGLRDTVHLVSWLEQHAFSHKYCVVINRIGESKHGVVRARDFSNKIGCPIIELPFDPRAIPQAQLHEKSLLDLRGEFRRGLDHVFARLPNYSAPTRARSFLAGLLEG